MKKIFIAIMLVAFTSTVVHAKDDDFKSVVKMIEQFYGVKHLGIPFLAKAAKRSGSPRPAASSSRFLKTRTSMAIS